MSAEDTPRIEIPSPVIRVVARNIGDISLSWLNCRQRRYGDMPPHVEFEDEGGNLKGFFPDPEVLDAMAELDFPYQYDPTVSIHPNDVDFYARMVAHQIMHGDGTGTSI